MEGDPFMYSKEKRKMALSKLLLPIKRVLNTKKRRAKNSQEMSKSTIKTTEVVLEMIARRIFGQLASQKTLLWRINEEQKRNQSDERKRSVSET